MKTQPACPECEKLAQAVKTHNTQDIGNFLSWMFGEGYVIAVWYDDELCPARKSIENMLAKYVGIDMDKVEQERRALLVWLREVQDEN